ncbi:MAG: cation-translocating P-type ATPase [Synergistaceae bacterium]|nr:cation-translocating P-type ATPase [Synergistaceae bacterium]
MSNQTQTFSFYIEGMTCATCSKMAERALSRVLGVSFATVNLATEAAFVTADDTVTEEVLFEAVSNVGFRPTKKIDANFEEVKYKKAKQNLILCWAVGLPFCLLMYLSEFAHITIPFYSYLELFSATFCLFYCGRGTFKSAGIALRHFHTNMNTLIAISAFSAWLTCVLSFFTSYYNFHSFGASAVMVMMFNLLGRFIESKLRAKASVDLKKLLSLAPTMARVVSDDGREMVLPVEAVKPDSIVCVRAGEKIALDGVITRGSSEVDESFISGESVPVIKDEGDMVTGGAINLTGELKYRVTKEARDTFLSQMTRLVEEAQGTKIPLQAMADRLTLVFVPFVLFVAILAFCFWRFVPITRQIATHYSALFFLKPVSGTALDTAIFAFIATLVIACPCALGLATPMAFITVSGVATKAGLLIRNMASLQVVNSAEYCIFDKTGTITEGKPKVFGSCIKEEDEKIAMAIESTSNHPIAKAICEFLSTNIKDASSISLTDVHEVAGQGIFAEFNGNKYFFGKETSALLSEDISIFKKRYPNSTLSFLYRNNICIGVFATDDKVRSDAAVAIKEIKNMGYIPILATGDKMEVANLVARQVGISSVHAKLSPTDKLTFIQTLRQDWREGDKENKDLVIMAGDGINDAPALKGADCSIAMGEGSQIAQEASDLIILSGGIKNIAYFIKLANYTTRIIHQNLFGALIYNVIAIPLAASGALHPAVAEMAMAASSITVVLNSLRILRVKR